MISEIGLVIGMYVCLRYLSFLTRKGSAQESLAVKILCIINLIITFFITIDLLVHPLSPTQFPRP